MKIRYFDLYVLKVLLNKYSNNSLYLLDSSFSINILLTLNKRLIISKCKNYKYIDAYTKYYKTYIFAFFYLVYVCLQKCLLNKNKMLYVYVYVFKYLVWFINFLNMCVAFFRSNDLIFYSITNKFWFSYGGQNNYFFKTDDLCNYLINNNIYLVLNFNNSIPRYNYNRLIEFDVKIININFFDEKSIYIYLNYLYYMKELSYYNKVLYIKINNVKYLV